MNAKEKAIIEAIIDKNNERKHDRALKLLLFGEEKGGSFSKNEYANLLKDLVKKKYARCFSFEDTYNTFATGFWMHLDKMTPEQLRSINDLKAWLFEVAKNYIESIRDIIEALQPNGLTNDDPGSYSEEPTPFDETESDKLERLDYAKWRFHHYLGKLTNETYKDLLEAVYIEGIDRETIAEEYGWTMAVLNLTLDHARNAFIAVALDKIQHCEPDLFKQYENHEDLDDETADLLHEFFITKYDVQQLALLHHKTSYEMKKVLSIAYKKLLRIHKKETELKKTHRHKEEKKQNRMLRLWEIHQNTVKKEYPGLYWMLFKYFKEFNGDSSAMTEWALNNNMSIDEMEQRLETSFDVLNTIDKERYQTKNNITTN